MSEEMRAAVDQVYKALSAEGMEAPKDLLYYICAETKGRADFRDLLGHTKIFNEMLVPINLVAKQGVLMVLPDSAGISFLDVYREAFIAMFEAEISTNSYKVPTFLRGPIG